MRTDRQADRERACILSFPLLAAFSIFIFGVIHVLRWAKNAHKSDCSFRAESEREEEDRRRLATPLLQCLFVAKKDVAYKFCNANCNGHREIAAFRIRFQSTTSPFVNKQAECQTVNSIRPLFRTFWQKWFERRVRRSSFGAPPKSEQRMSK